MLLLTLVIFRAVLARRAEDHYNPASRFRVVRLSSKKQS
jgi:hypothetical protein